jgi:hypothetical protein
MNHSGKCRLRWAKAARCKQALISDGELGARLAKLLFPEIDLAEQLLPDIDISLGGRLKREHAAMAAQRERERQVALAEWARTAPLRIGDIVDYVYYVVTAPTHKRGPKRMIRIRYEEGRRYVSGRGGVAGYCRGGYVINGREILNDDIFDSAGEAHEAARCKQLEYDEHCRFSEMCR